VPAVLYGHGEKPRHISIPAREFASAIRHGGMTQVFNIEISDGTTALALPKAIQRDPIRDTFEHVDLLVVRRGERVTVEVPVHLIGEAARDTLVVIEHNTLAILADATKLPDHLDVSIQGLEPGTRVTAAEVEMPAGSSLAADRDLVIAVISASPTAEELEGPSETPAETPAEPTEAQAPAEA
jgi:large subunit ribosomal protein L25